MCCTSTPFLLEQNGLLSFRNFLYFSRAKSMTHFDLALLDQIALYTAKAKNVNMLLNQAEKPDLAYSTERMFNTCEVLHIRAYTTKTNLLLKGAQHSSFPKMFSRAVTQNFSQLIILQLKQSVCAALAAIVIVIQL